MVLTKERDQLVKQRDSANQEAHLWRSELAKARERIVILEGAVVRAEEKVRVTEADAEARIKEAAQKEAAAVKEKQELLAYVNMLQAQFKRSVSRTTLTCEIEAHIFQCVQLVLQLFCAWITMASSRCTDAVISILNHQCLHNIILKTSIAIFCKRARAKNISVFPK